MRTARSPYRWACAALTLAAAPSSASATGEELYVQFFKQTPAAAPNRYVLPAVEADNDSGAHGPSSGARSTCNDDRTNPDAVWIWLTDQQDETPWRSAPPGTFRRVDFEHHVTVRIAGTATYGCDYELYLRPEGCATGCRVEPTLTPAGNLVFVLEVPADARRYAPSRSIDIRFLTDPGMEPEPLDAVTLQVQSVTIAGSPTDPPTLAVGGNRQVTWLLEDNPNPAPADSAGDECDSALAIGAEGTYLFDTTGMTASAVPASCAGTPSDVWFAFTAPFNADYFFDTYASRVSTLVEVYGGTCGNLTSIGCNDGPTIGLTGSGVEVACTSGSTYYVRVGQTSATPGFGLLTINDLQPGMGPFVQLGHATPATRTAITQVATKVAHDSSDLRPMAGFNSDYFGIRFLDVDRNTGGLVSGIQIAPGSDVRIHLAVNAYAEASYELFTDSELTTTVAWNGTSFTLDADPTALGVGFWAEFYPIETGPALFDIAFRLTDATSSVGELPKVGWNTLGKWLVIN